jgi:hypothetical protein
MVSVLASSVVDRGYEPRSGQTKDYKIGICCFFAKHAALRKKSRLVGSESGQCVGVGQHVCLQTVCISLSFFALFLLYCMCSEFYFNFLFYIIQPQWVPSHEYIKWFDQYRIRVMVFNAPFNNIPVKLWHSVLLVEEIGENHK